MTLDVRPLTGEALIATLGRSWSKRGAQTLNGIVAECAKAALGDTEVTIRPLQCWIREL